MHARLLIARLGLATVVSCGLLTPSALADTINYTVDPSSSVLTLSGMIDGINFTRQVADPNSLLENYSGIIAGNRDFSIGTLQITGGTISALDAGTYGPWNLPAAYGMSAFAFGDVEVGDFLFSLSSLDTFAASSFNTSELVGLVSSGYLGYLDYDVAVVPGGANLGEPASTLLSGNLSLDSELGSTQDNAGIETLTIPVHSSILIPISGTALGSQVVSLNLTGTIVAVATVPEPVFSSFSIIPFIMFSLRRRI